MTCSVIQAEKTLEKTLYYPMGGNFSVGFSTPHLGCTAPSSYLSLDCVSELATTDLGLAVGLGLVVVLHQEKPPGIIGHNYAIMMIIDAKRR